MFRLGLVLVVARQRSAEMRPGVARHQGVEQDIVNLTEHLLG